MLLHDTLSAVDLPDLWPFDILIVVFSVFNPRDLYYKVQKIIIITITRTIFMVLSSWLRTSHCESSPGSFADSAPAGYQPSDQAN